MHRVACLSSITFLSLSLLFSSYMFAAEKRPCSDDIQKFCCDVKPQKGAIADCLKQHESELSAQCSDHIAKMNERRQKAREFRQACKDDVSKFCKDVPGGHGAIIRCLKEHESELSFQCSENMKAAKTK